MPSNGIKRREHIVPEIRYLSNEMVNGYCNSHGYPGKSAKLQGVRGSPVIKEAVISRGANTLENCYSTVSHCLSAAGTMAAGIPVGTRWIEMDLESREIP